VAGLVNAGRLGSVSLDQNRDLLLQAVACVVLGGTSLLGGQGSMGRTLLGVLTFTTLDIGLNQMKIEDHARPLVLGTVLMVALVANGLLSRRGA
jgi:ribose/xylose/arabinose/galactoside ABC-type transport system permease subunit